MTGIAGPGWDGRAWTARDHAALAELDVALVAAPDRLARNYVHQVLLVEELAGLAVSTVSYHVSG